MSRIVIRDNLRGFWCPGCNEMHYVGGGWAYNGDADKPTLHPSVLVRSGHHAGQDHETCWCTFETRYGKPSPYRCFACHSFVTDGQIQFLSDSTHALAGQTVPLPEI